MFDKIDPNTPGSSRFWKLRNECRVSPLPSRWPLPRLSGHDPIAIPANNDRMSVDIGYAPMTSVYDDLYVPVYAAQTGNVAFAGETESGFAITLDHGSWSTHYAHLSKMFVKQNLRRMQRLQSVRAGEVIGYAAKSPLHVRFEIWDRTYTSEWISADPIPRMKSWIIESPEQALRPTLPEPQQVA
ncbi:MAG: M23 family metallopeptidase [Kofleriaceae bacterium]